MYFRLKDLDLSNKRILVRAGFDVPLDESGNITDDSRIKKCIPTFKYILDRKGILIILSHNGRPKGNEKNLNMDKIATALENLMGIKVIKVDDCVGEDVKKKINTVKPGKTILLENVRFHKEESDEDEAVRTAFAQKLSELADIYVNEAFAVSHREQASLTEITKFLPSCAGILMEQEIEYCSLIDPNKPFNAIIGGAKADKIGVIKNFINKVDNMIIGGVLANTFLKAQGVDIKASKFDQETLDVANEILKLGKIRLPVDFVVADKFDKNANTKIVNINQIPDGWMSMDIGPETIKLYKELLMPSKTIIWGGPIGVFEWDRFAAGTRELAYFISGLSAKTIIGGGDSAAAVAKYGLEEKMTHVSTGGGASLELMSGNALPGIEALEKNYKERQNGR